MTEMLNSVIEFDEDLNGVEAPKPLPMGTYDATIQSAEVTKSKSDRPMVKVSFLISADQYPADFTDGNPNGTILTKFLMADMSAQSKFAMKRFCMAIGAPMSNQVDVNSWIGLPAKVEVINELYEGNLTARLNKVIG